MKICDRCKQQVNSLTTFEVVDKTWSSSVIEQPDTEVCPDCYIEGKEILNNLGCELDLAQRKIMLEARQAWLDSPLKLAIPAKHRNYATLTDDGRTWIEILKQKFISLFEGRKTTDEL